MNNDEINNIENRIEDIEEEADKLREQKTHLHKLDMKLAEMLVNVRDDRELYEILSEKQQAAENVREEVERRIEENELQTEDILKTIDEMTDETNRSMKTLNELEELKEDVNEAKEILNYRLTLLTECRNRLERVQEKLQEKHNGGRTGSLQMPGISDGAQISENSRKAADALPEKRSIPFETGYYSNGTPVVKGEHFEKYISDYYNHENMTYKELQEQPYIITVDPASIEGISLSREELENSSRFWGRAGKDHTHESFLEIASRIPEVQKQLSEGKSLREVQEDPRLGSCAGIYFSPSNVPKVIKCGDYYEFLENGRHRILAAREAGHNIRVKLIGYRNGKK